MEITKMCYIGVGKPKNGTEHGTHYRVSGLDLGLD